VIAILDYGFGNVKSVWNALDALGEDPYLAAEGKELDQATHLIIPGVGSYDVAMAELQARDLFEPVACYVRSGRPLLGICLGMQLLGDYGEEGKGARGLGLIPGQILSFPDSSGLDVPHAGWNTARLRSGHPVFSGLPEHSDFYFVHSYRFVCAEPEHVWGTTDYGEDFCSVVGSQNVLGVQFHPEKSQKKGLRLLENFCEWDGKC